MDNREAVATVRPILAHYAPGRYSPEMTDEEVMAVVREMGTEAIDVYWSALKGIAAVIPQMTLWARSINERAYPDRY